MRSDLLLVIIGEAKEEYVLSALESRNGMNKERRYYTRKRIFLIAAVIAVLGLLVGCGAYIVARELFWSETLQEDMAPFNEMPDIGNVSKNWVIDESSVALSAEPPLAGEIRITCREWGQDAECVLTVGNEYWIEMWNGSAYVEIPTQDRTAWIVPEQRIECGTQYSWSANYLEKYGELLPGDYRIGMMLSKESPDGQIAQLGCYAKFNVQDAAYAPTLEAFRTALNDILHGDAYYIIRYSYDLPFYSTDSAVRTEILKCGDNYAECITRKSAETEEWSKEGKGRLYRNGVGYAVEWSGDSVRSQPKTWTEADYVTAEIPLWSVFFDSAYQSAIEASTVDNQLRILALTGLKLDQLYEMRIFFRGDGSIYRMECAGIPDKAYAEEDRELWVAVEILPISPEEAEAALQRMIELCQ